MTGDAVTARGLMAAVQDELMRAVDEMTAQQLALLPLPGTELMEAGEVDPRTGKRGPGRPPGARNRSTQAWVKKMRASYRDPGEFLAMVFNTPLPRLMAQLHAKPEDLLEVLKAQLYAANVLMPYWHQKMGTADGDDKPPVPISIQVTEEGAKLIAGSRRLGGGVVVDGEVVGKGNDDESKT